MTTTNNTFFAPQLFIPSGVTDIQKTTPHKYNSYIEIICLSYGKGFHSVDSRPYPVTRPVVYVVRKEQMHHWELEDEPDGYRIIIKKWK
jgi:AraC family transcriptional regulator, transcriptional activator of pobA